MNFATEDALVWLVFVVTYLGMAGGRVPGLALDRTGITLSAVIVLLLIGALSPDHLAAALELPTLLLLFVLMLIAAHFERARRFDWIADHLLALVKDRVVAALSVALVLLLDRRFSTRDLLSEVDGPLLVMIGCLFATTAPATGLPAAQHTMTWLKALHLLSYGLGSLALFSTLSGNLLLTGSLANIIVAERGTQAKVTLGFIDFARVGLPVTVLSTSFAAAWLWCWVS